MSSDLLREAERAAVISLKSDAPLLTILPKTSIDPQPKTAGFDAQGAPVWPFVRMGESQAVLSGRGCTERSEVTFIVHTFAKPRYSSAGAILETAKDYAARANSAVVAAIRNRTFVVSGRRYRFTVRSSRLSQDGAEADAYHGIVNVVARVFNG